jgi:secreted PhoX family phosphatase
MELFGLSAAGAPSVTSVDRALLAINHEATTDQTLSSFFLHANGGTKTLPRPAAEVDKETAIHGLAVVEVRKTGTSWSYVMIPPSIVASRHRPMSRSADRRVAMRR